MSHVNCASSARQISSFLNNRAKHLARVAAEYSQLLYHARKAEDAQCVFVDEIRWVRLLSTCRPCFLNKSKRIERVHSTLSSDLDQLFSQVVRSLTGDTKGSELERTKTIADLMDCLQTYDNLGLWRDAEDILRREVMRVFVKKVSSSATCVLDLELSMSDNIPRRSRRSSFTHCPKYAFHTGSASALHCIWSPNSLYPIYCIHPKDSTTRRHRCQSPSSTSTRREGRSFDRSVQPDSPICRKGHGTNHGYRRKSFDKNQRFRYNRAYTNPSGF